MTDPELAPGDEPLEVPEPELELEPEFTLDPLDPIMQVVPEKTYPE